ncbi:hypothetical protein HPB51_027620 [Rhipicephalus microplus]|uniref:Uncharacterized protein n=1 Tax=Rhipicephalus microplus TaxID=6941 RepID=A0A9J6CZN4_RHIMP|nr:hypothetical protein HPB51_027620 [Rhipicephalus microplus]
MWSPQKGSSAPRCETIASGHFRLTGTGSACWVACTCSSFGHYMEIEKRFDSIWGIRNKFKRYWQQDVWNRLFSNLLNNPSCSELPDLMPFVLEIKSLLRYKSCAHSVVVEALRTKNF